MTRSAKRDGVIHGVWIFLDVFFHWGVTTLLISTLLESATEVNLLLIVCLCRVVCVCIASVSDASVSSPSPRLGSFLARAMHAWHQLFLYSKPRDE